MLELVRCHQSPFVYSTALNKNFITPCKTSGLVLNNTFRTNCCRAGPSLNIQRKICPMTQKHTEHAWSPTILLY